MDTGNDPRLKRLMQEWQVPNAPDALEQRVLGQRRPWWRSLLTSRVRVPLPVAIAVSVLLVWFAALAVRDRVPEVQPPGTTYDLRGFQPVNSVSVRIERSSDAIP
jgi:hypothetical protein